MGTLSCVCIVCVFAYCSSFHSTHFLREERQQKAEAEGSDDRADNK